MTNKNLYSLIPKVDELLADEKIEKLLSSLPRRLVVDTIREELDKVREKIRKNISKEELEKYLSSLVEKIINQANKKNSYKLKRVVNATGVVIHTNLGRSPLNQEVIDNIREVATNYSNLEFDLKTGGRGSRYSHLEDIIKEITGGEAALVVNNNAAAVMLALSTLAKDREVIVSRGELIEIGGSFRIPDVMEESGASLVAVGTTNKTHLEDYERAITEETAALLKVHTSNYRILGFTSSVDAKDLSSLKDKYQLPLIEDLGSGILIDLSKYGIDYEPTVQDSLKKGVDVVTFSGDKLLGGPQAGIIVGKKKYIEEMKRNPLTRALRVDKFTLTALETILKLYLEEEKAVEKIPTLRMLTLGLEEIDKRAKKLFKEIKDLNLDKDLEIAIEDSYSEVGGGSMPLVKLDSRSLVLSCKSISSQELEKRLRSLQLPIITRLYRDKIYMDLRTIKEEEIPLISQGIKEVFKIKESQL